MVCTEGLKSLLMRASRPEGSIPGDRMAGLGMSASYLPIAHAKIAFDQGHAHLNSQELLRVPVSSHPCQHRVLSSVLFFANLIGGFNLHFSYCISLNLRYH